MCRPLFVVHAGLLLFPALVLGTALGSGFLWPERASAVRAAAEVARVTSPPYRPRPLPPAPGMRPLVPMALPLGDVVSGLSNLEDAIAGVQSLLDNVATWMQSAAMSARNAIAQIIGAAPGYLPDGTQLSDLVGQILDLPDTFRQTITTMLAAWGNGAPPGTLAAAHESYVASSPVLTRDATGIATSSAVVAASSVREDVGVQATTAAAQAAASDLRLDEVALAAHQAGDAMLQGAPNLPSSRAGIEMLVAGMGAGMEQQADAAASLGDRLTALMQQTAAVSEQVGALGQTAAALTARDAERDRRDLDARLGLMDALRAGGQTLTSMLADADESSDVEPILSPLY
jgi:hypothetical protein